MTSDAVTRAPDFTAWFGPDAFDATYGDDLPALRGVRPCPAPPGFAEHWQGRYTRAREVAPALQRVPVGTLEQHEVFSVQIATTRGTGAALG